MFLAWLVVILCFFVLAIQLFITLIEFKLTTLAGFVLVPFALWNKTAFLAEKVLGNVVSSGIKVLVLAVIVGIGSGLFAEFQVHPAEPSIDHALVVMLASLTLLALGIFGPGIATGLVSGAPQLGAGAMAGAAVGRGRHGVAVGAAADGRGRRRHGRGAHGPGSRQAGRQRCACRHSAASSARSAFQAGSAGRRRPKGAAAGVGNVAKTGAQPPGRRWPRALPMGRRWPLLPRWLERPKPARPAPASRRRHRSRSKSNPPGPSACTAASSSPMPRPPPPTRCAAATAAAPGKARACAIPIPDLQGEHPCDSNDRRCATPTRRSLPPRTKPPPRCGTSASARPACRRRTGA
jgi:type IV secretion system protein TrbL